ncbi:MAG: fasciclin [Flavobacteriales bacterium]|nr:fasciclin [Flavobacteriales bacterium]
MITMKHFLSLLAFLGLVLGLQAQTANTSEACHGDYTVHASNSGFSPDHLTIHAGESVEFIAFGGTHDVDGITNVYTGEPFDNPQDFALPPAYSFWFFGSCIGTVQFDVPGTYHYNSTTTGNGGTITVLGDDGPATVVDIVVNSPVHNVLEAAVLEADLAGALSSDGPFTVFAPTDDAFIALAGALGATAEELLALPELTDILLYHVVGGTALSTDLSDGQFITTLNGADVVVTINDEGIFINNAQVTVADIVAGNGVVHVIDAVLLPTDTPEPTNTVVDIVVNSPVHNVLEAAVLQADLAGALSGEGPFTVFAPTDDAFLSLAGALGATAEDLLALPELADILLYHVVGSTALSSDLTDGQTIATLNGAEVTVTINEAGIFINDAQVTVADLVADNGVVHVIDAVLIPPTSEPTGTVVDIVVNSEVHNLLEAAVLEADLAETLSGEGPFTVFAPTDDAFIALAEALTLAPEDLLALPELADILLYHVVGATALSTDLSDGQMVTTLNGADVTVTINEAGIFINDAQVIVADLVATNGVVHVIDAVLTPPVPTNTVVDIIVNSDIHTILEAAVLEADLVGALSGEGPFTVFAPTDEAFAALAEALGATASDLLALPELTDILLYHVVGATAFSTDLSDGQMVATLNGAEVEVSIECDGSIFINDAQVILADIEADNGVVHVLDAVLLPPTPSNACEDGGCCGEGTVWDPITQTCIAEDCHGDMNDDGFISIGDILMMLGFFGHDCQ